MIEALAIIALVAVAATFFYLKAKQDALAKEVIEVVSKVSSAQNGHEQYFRNLEKDMQSLQVELDKIDTDEIIKAKDRIAVLELAAGVRRVDDIKQHTRLNKA